MVALPYSNESKRCRRNGKQCRPWSDFSSRSSLIWVCTVCPDISVRKLRIITVPCTHGGMSMTNEPRHDKTNKMSVRPARTQISLIWVFAGCTATLLVLSYCGSNKVYWWSFPGLQGTSVWWHFHQQQNMSRPIGNVSLSAKLNDIGRY